MSDSTDNIARESARDKHLIRLITMRHGDRKQGWDARARKRAIEALVEHHNLKAMSVTEAFLDFVIAHLQLTPRKDTI